MQMGEVMESLDYCLKLQPLCDDGLALDLTFTCFAVILAAVTSAEAAAAAVLGLFVCACLCEDCFLFTSWK